MHHQSPAAPAGGAPEPRHASQGLSTQTEHIIAQMEGTAALPRQNGELVFKAPWESRAFGMAVALYEQGGYQHWDEFRSRLIGAIAAWEQQQSTHDVPWHYYTQWLAALERLVVEKGLLSTAEIEARTAEVLSGTWDEKHTHHHADGEPHNLA